MSRQIDPAAERRERAKKARQAKWREENREAVRRGARNFWRGVQKLVIAAQFDVFANPSRRGMEERPYIVSIQSSLWDGVATRICVPLIEERFIRPQGRLNPRIVLKQRPLYFHPLEVLTIPKRMLREPIANLEEYRYQLVAALDLMFTGV